MFNAFLQRTLSRQHFGYISWYASTQNQIHRIVFHTIIRVILVPLGDSNGRMILWCTLRANAHAAWRSSPEIARLAMFMLLTTATLTQERRQVYLMIDEFQ